MINNNQGERDSYPNTGIKKLGLDWKEEENNTGHPVKQ